MTIKRIFSLFTLAILALAWVLYPPIYAWAGSGWLPVGSRGFSSDAAGYTSMALDQNNTPYVAYSDYANGQKATVMKYNNATSTWQVMGAAGFSAGETDYVTLVLDSQGNPYVAYVDLSISGRPVIVMKYNGAKWETVGLGIYSAYFSFDLALDNDGTPYLAYEDWSHGAKATVVKYNGASWVTVGSAAFTSSVVTDISLKLDKNHIPYISYRDGDNNTGVSVMKYSGGAWVTVGTPKFSAGDGTWTSIALDSNNLPYVAYVDYATNGNKATVMKYTGSAWQTVGTAGFSLSGASKPTMKLDSNNTPYVAYQENGTPVINARATVMKYTGTAWVAVGSAGFSAGTVDSISLALDSSGTPFVAYKDGISSNKVTVMKYYEVLPPASFNKTGPTNAVKDVTPNPTLGWGASDGATSYEYCYDTTNNSACDTAWMSAGANTSVRLTQLKAKTAYYWQVRAVNAGGTTYADTSIWGSFTTGYYKVCLPSLKR